MGREPKNRAEGVNKVVRRSTLPLPSLLSFQYLSLTLHCFPNHQEFRENERKKQQGDGLGETSRWSTDQPHAKEVWCGAVSGGEEALSSPPLALGGRLFCLILLDEVDTAVLHVTHCLLGIIPQADVQPRCRGGGGMILR